MIIKLSPQGRSENKIWYEITENKITATINDISDTFDFAGMPNGELQIYDEDGNSLIETVLGEAPILSAKKENDVLTVEILFSIDIREQDERLLFPEPMTLDEFNELMDELVERKKEDESVDSLEETDDLVEPDEVVDDDIIVEDERVDEEEPVHKNDDIINIEEVDF